MLKAWVGMILLANEDWFYASLPLAIAPPSRNFGFTRPGWKHRKMALSQAGDYHPKVVGHQYPCKPIDFRLCHFNISSARRAGDSGTSGCVLDAQFQKQSLALRNTHLNYLRVKCKLVDVMCHPDLGVSLQREANTYAALVRLQGKAIPKFHGYYNVWGILRLLALEPVGDAITEDEIINEKLRRKMKATLGRIHKAGYIHGDIARRNFCKKRSGTKILVFLVDLEMSRRARDQAELDKEMRQVDEL
jgi:hypothetical protein